MDIIEKNKDLIETLCKTHNVDHLYVFGSVLTEKFNNTSDVDFLVDFKNIEVLEYADNYFDLKFSLEDILKHPVDLVENKAIKNPVFRRVVDREKQLVYG